MRKIAKVLLPFVIVFSFLTAIPAVNASMVSEAQNYTVGYQYNGVSKSNHSVYFKFTLKANSLMDFWSKCEYNCGKTLSVNQNAPLVAYKLYSSSGNIVFDSDNMTFSNNIVTGYCEGEYSLYLPKDTYYLDVYGIWGQWDYSFNFITHTHTYVTNVKKASTKANGKIVEKCSKCGNVKNATTIYYPKTVKLSPKSYSYDGKQKNPVVMIIDANGKKISSKNYSLKWASGRKNVGTYKLQITYKGNYSGSVTKTFNIVPRGTSISSLKGISKGFIVKWNKQANQTTGYQIKYSINASMKSAKTIAVTKNNIVSKNISKLKAKKKYYVQVRTYKKKSNMTYYSNWSEKRAVMTKG